MQFTKQFWPGIADGSVTLAFRGWIRPTVVAGRTYRTPGGRVEVTSVDEIDPASLTEVEATRAGHASVDAVLAQVRTDGDRRLFRVEFTLLAEPDPREALAEADVLSEYDVEAITARLDRLDRSSKAGPWTVSALRVIGDNPERRAGDLSAMVDREKEAFKLDVRKLKNLGLTYSLRTGYELSPRGRAYIAAIDGIDGR